MRVATFNILNGRVPTDQHVDLDGSARRSAASTSTCWPCRRWTATSTAPTTPTSRPSPPRPWGRPSTVSSRRCPAASARPGWRRPERSSPTRRPTASRCSRATRCAAGGSCGCAPAPAPVPMRFAGRLRPELVRDEPRVAVVADIETPEGPVTVANTHLSFINLWNGRQLRRLTADLTQGPDPLVLMGDLNMGAQRASRITGMRSAVQAVTFPKESPSQQIDHVLVRGPVTAGSGESVLLPVSDHRALRVELDPHLEPSRSLTALVRPCPAASPLRGRGCARRARPSSRGSGRSRRTGARRWAPGAPP